MPAKKKATRRKATRPRPVHRPVERGKREARVAGALRHDVSHTHQTTDAADQRQAERPAAHQRCASVSRSVSGNSGEPRRPRRAAKYEADVLKQPNP